ncbi:uncharacterized protein LOC18422840 [Amborella trichopoda]|uniref:30S ribosomal protein S9 n=2 Tax=Magnoliopsida TaxID=3398 RepID=W1NIC0_AMBTC|nr:uncharacterized protein LOC18422840 [Amborella trichopoda]ERM94969.1 hypothetical protein AMTR_s00009p00218530 [Amborella trichopoda]|eukprot:XP_006827553.1 uncharacterized protein LOC18422840 [Amborella trichopoda]
MFSRCILRPNVLHLLTLISATPKPSFPPRHVISHHKVYQSPVPNLAKLFSTNGSNGSDTENEEGEKRNTINRWSFSPENGSEKWDIFNEKDDNAGFKGLAGLGGEEEEREISIGLHRESQGVLERESDEGEKWLISGVEKDGLNDLAGFGGEEERGIHGGIEREKGEGLERESDEEDKWSVSGVEEDIFKEVDKEFGSKGKDDEWETAEGFEPWSFDEGEEGKGMEGISEKDGVEMEPELSEADKLLEEEEKGLSVVLKGPNRAFGDLIAASGITEVMLDSLIALKDLEGIEGLPPLSELEDARLANSERKSPRFEMEQQKQEEIAKTYVRKVDEKGRAYGTGRRKCSIARVWVQPGDGKFIVNDKQFDVYFPILDHRIDLLKPFVETKTLGLWDVKCTVKGGGVSGQAGAIRLGISRALQNWEPGLRSYLRSTGLLTRDPRVVERKKPGKAKARKSFQWVKR